MPELPPFNPPPPRPSTVPQPPQDSAVPLGDLRPIAHDPEPTQVSALRSILVWAGRWALLGAGVVAAWLLGVLIAQWFPAANPRPPLQEFALRRTLRFTQKLQSLPAWWAGDPSSMAVGTGSASPPATSVAPQPPSPPITLPAAQREIAAGELAALTEEIQRLRDRTTALERQLGLPTVDIALEERLKNAQNRLSPPTEATTLPPNQPSPAVTEVPPSQDPLFQVNAWRVTLPGDVLFAPGQSTLFNNAYPLLDSLLPDIARYPNATVVVGSYTDAEVPNASLAEISYQQSLAVQRYLEQRLGKTGHHWLAVGYGSSTVGSASGPQLTRRVTIAIVPK